MLLLRTAPMTVHVQIWSQIRHYSITELESFSKGIQWMFTSNPSYRRMDENDFRNLYTDNVQKESEQIAQLNLEVLWAHKNSTKDLRMTEGAEMATSETVRLKMAFVFAEGIAEFHEELKSALHTQAHEMVLQHFPDVDPLILQNQLQMLIPVLTEDSDQDRLNGLVILPAVLSKLRTFCWTFTAMNLMKYVPMDIFFLLTPEKIFDIMLKATPWSGFLIKVSKK